MATNTLHQKLQILYATNLYYLLLMSTSAQPNLKNEISHINHGHSSELYKPRIGPLHNIPKVANSIRVHTVTKSPRATPLADHCNPHQKNISQVLEKTRQPCTLTTTMLCRTNYMFHNIKCVITATNPWRRGQPRISPEPLWNPIPVVPDHQVCHPINLSCCQ